MATRLLEPPTNLTAFDLVEWLETTMVLEAIERISQAEVEERFPSGQTPGASVIEEAAAEMAYRASRAPDVYPFRAGEEEIYADRTVDPRIYRFLLVLSMEQVPYRTESRYNDIGPSLELITREAALGMFGEGAEGRRFGWPVGDGRPEHLIDAVKWLAEAMGLETTDTLEREVDEDDKDGGIDVAAWHGLGDKNPGFPVLLIQCTVQSRWEKKPSDVVPERWSAWIRFGKQPTIGLAVPQAVPGDAKVRAQTKYTTGVLLERVRICQLLDSRDLTEFDEYTFMEEWTTKEIALIVRQLTAPPEGKTGKTKKTPRPRLARRRGPVKLRATEETETEASASNEDGGQAAEAEGASGDSDGRSGASPLDRFGRGVADVGRRIRAWLAPSTN